MLCGLLILAIVSFNARCDECCSSYQCALIDQPSDCGSKFDCKWEDGACVKKACAEFDESYTCVIPHDNFYCKWNTSEDKCVAGTGACADFDGFDSECIATGKCKYGTDDKCVAASSCGDLSDPLYISKCDSASFNGVDCVKDGTTCKAFTCGSVPVAQCSDIKCFQKDTACVPVTSCSDITDSSQCGLKYDSGGNKCVQKDTACKTLECSDLTTGAACATLPTCRWSPTDSVCSPGDPCSVPSTEVGCGTVLGTTCYFLTSCSGGAGSSSSMIYVPALFAALVLVLLL